MKLYEYMDQTSALLIYKGTFIPQSMIVALQKYCSRNTAFSTKVIFKSYILGL